MKPKFDNKFHEVVYNLNQLFGKVEEVLAIITLWILIAVCVVFISARFIFHVPTPWADELARYFLILLGWMGAAYASSHNDHLSIDIIGGIVEKRAKDPEKILAVLDRIAQILSLIFLIRCFVSRCTIPERLPLLCPLTCGCPSAWFW